MANKLLTREEFRKLLYTGAEHGFVNVLVPAFWGPVDSVLFYMGKQVVHRDDQTIILFEACEWCGGCLLDKNNNCINCGGYATASNRDAANEELL